jgi:hypothetical protein
MMTITMPIAAALAIAVLSFICIFILFLKPARAMVLIKGFFVRACGAF